MAGAEYDDFCGTWLWYEGKEADVPTGFMITTKKADGNYCMACYNADLSDRKSVHQVVRDGDTIVVNARKPQPLVQKAPFKYAVEWDNGNRWYKS
eukprot:CAMPEP_0205822110 /NCGR_PEP_ID=MMETSP0206-20130828/10888_1 /ASSEMBLY_ACC=CAM_ASM_000279 /TAXON_ID=36767 /ORGANISM="Euplotes focardii, Strain TN1" /LENGTH=94 /DNA_ID=CAMNT_0053118101 /DNA_START=26 /DNA_END=310 /DNA_ORIENTATION=+